MTKLEDKHFEELKQRIVTTTGIDMKHVDLDTTLATEEGVIVNAQGIITGVQKIVYEKKHDSRKYLFEINKQLSGYRVIVEDNDRGLSTVVRVDTMKDLDELLRDVNPFKEVQYTSIGDTFKGKVG